MICVRYKFVQLFFVFSKSAEHFFKHHGNGGPAKRSDLKIFIIIILKLKTTQPTQFIHTVQSKKTVGCKNYKTGT